MADLYPFQKQLLIDIKSKDIKSGEMRIMMAGRQTGKSMLGSHAFQRLWEDLHARPVENLVLSEGTVYGSRYYTVEPVGGYWTDMELWCHTTFGDPGDHMWGEKKAPKPGHRWYMNNRKFWFRHEKDRDWFILKWRS